MQGMHGITVQKRRGYMSRFDEMIEGLREEVEIPERVWREYVGTLEGLSGRNGDRMRRGNRRKRRNGGMYLLKAAALVLAAVTLLGTGAYAAGRYFGILDFLRGSGNEAALPPVEAEELIVPVAESEQEKTQVTEGMSADYTVKEAMCDSDTVYVVLEAKAKEEGRYFFVPEDACKEDSVREFGIDSNLSVAEYAASKGLAIKHVNAGIVNTEELGIAASTIYFRSVEDDVMDIMVEAGKTEKGETLDMVCTGICWEEGMTDMEDIERTEIRFALMDISGAEATDYVPAGSGEIPGTDALIEKAQVIQTKLGTYLEIVYRDESGESYAGPCFRISDGPGTERRIRTGSGTELLENGEFFWRMSLEKTEFGDSITLEAYDEETKEVYGTFELVRK